MKITLSQKLSAGYLFFDGGFGSEIAKKGLSDEILQNPYLLNRDHADDIIAIHQAYLAAGCDILTANTFTANPFKAKQLGFPLDEAIRLGMQNAKQAIAESGLEDRYVALDIGPSGKLMQPLGECSFDEMYENYRAIVTLGETYGADFILFETFSDLYELKTAILAAKENTNLPIFATMTLEKNLHTLTGSSPEIIACVLEDLGVSALGLNCSLGPAELQGAAKKMVSFSHVPVIIQPNAGLPKIEDGKTVYEIDKDIFAGELVKMAQTGVRVFGGCCGTTPEHIRAAIDAVKANTPQFKTVPQKNTACSYQQQILLDEIKADELFSIPISSETVDLSDPQAPDCTALVDLAFEAIDEEALAILLEADDSFPITKEIVAAVLLELQSLIRLPILFRCKDEAVCREYLRRVNGKGAIV
jgi:5-methyltetrahydrofolate--homocysteine methyltransferase